MYEPSKLLAIPQPIKLEEWRKVLLDAAEHIRVHGHCKGNATNSAGAVCMLHAINVSADRDVPAILTRVGHFIGKEEGIVAWNDAPERTKEDVIRALEECARQ